MTIQSFLDLDELILLCRNENAKNFIQEAVQCYKGGSFRQAIVATWIAVVYDIIHKFQELELTGDANATKYLEQYEKIRKAGDLRGSLDFEKNILKVAKEEFELITEIEYIDLIRLQEDRNRCAHPAMNSSDEIYQPSPELARTHLRNAVEHLLQRQPVQVKAALGRLVADVESEYFPRNNEEAIKYFSVGPLSRPKASLVRNFVIVLTKSLLTSDFERPKRDRYFAALHTVIQLERGISHATLATKLNNIVVGMPDENLFSVLRFVARIEETWQYLDEDSKAKLKNFVANLSEEQESIGLFFAFMIADLVESAISRLNSIRTQSIAVLSNLQEENNKRVHPEVVEKATTNYIDSGNFSLANDIGEHLIIPLAKYLLPEQIERIIRASEENSQIKGSYQMNAVLRHIRDCKIISIAQFNELLKKYGVVNIDIEEAPIGEPSKT